ncbi:MAG: hypothetical protein F6J89_32795, partial [Symploca sp. SIO1C4]|nr:hypothetical protein [Symploca sp. SIO1C4]
STPLPESSELLAPESSTTPREAPASVEEPTEPLEEATTKEVTPLPESSELLAPESSTTPREAPASIEEPTEPLEEVIPLEVSEPPAETAPVL